MDQNAVRNAWNAKTEVKAKDRFWFFPEITGHFNRKICGAALPGAAGGINQRLMKMGPFQLGVSVGCGMATKELNLVSRNIVRRMDLFDLADERLAKADASFAAKGIRDRVTMNCRDPLGEEIVEQYDLVYWNSSLHHMPDTRLALAWSKRALKPGGLLALFEYVGPSRFQYSDRMLEAVRAFRQALPEHLKPPKSDRWVMRPTVEEMIKRDPSEACDSDNILPALMELFPEAEVINLGGAIYSFGLNGVFPKMTEQDQWLFAHMLALDDQLADMGEYQNVAAFARK